MPFVEDEEKIFLKAVFRSREVTKTHRRMTEWDFTRIQEEALKEGLPYQSLLSSIIHKYLTGQFKEDHR